MKTFYNFINKPFLKIVYNKTCKIYDAYCVGQYVDNLHLEFLKKYYIPKDSITCCNSRSIYKLI